MPKAIDNARHLILNTTEKILKEEGYEDITIRRLARLCKIAPGTIYNYYPSKDDIVREIMLKDWNQARSQMEKSCEETPSLQEGLRNIHTLLHDFIITHKETWLLMLRQVDRQLLPEMRYNPRDFNQELSKIIAFLLKKYSQKYLSSSIPEQDFLCGFIVRNLTSYAMEMKTTYSKLEKIIKQIV